jgi:two-component system phosphate regulon sensor histidine kinase PhoR
MRRIARSLFPAAAVMTAPAAGVFIVLVAARQLDLIPALVGALAIFGLIAVVLRAYLKDLDDAAQFMRKTTPGETAAVPTLRRTGPAEELLSAAGQMARTFSHHNDAMVAQVISHETVLDSLPYPLFMLNDLRRVVRNNLAARRLLGRDSIGRDLSAVLRDPSVLEACDEVLGGSGGRVIEFSLPVPVNRVFKARVEPLPMKIVDGSVAVLALHDMTELKRAEQMRADFVANASHELRTPLATLLGFIETLRTSARDDPEARERFLGIMFEQGSRMSRLVADLLSLSRIEMNEHQQPADSIAIGPLLRGVKEALEPQAAARNIAVDLTIPDNLPEVLGQADELTQVFQNLLDNAIKYGRENSRVEVTARVAQRVPATLGSRLGPGALAVAVKDSSEGIPSEHLPRLTERFFRVDAARSRKLGGTGLGLAIVKHVLNRHRGALHVESTIGQGSVFTVYLPPAEDSAQTSPPARLASSG